MAERSAGRTTLAVHRCRFVDFTPSAITALAFPPLPLPSLKGKNSASTHEALKFGTLAVGRANGNIEICEWTGTNGQIQSHQAWVVRKTLSGPFPSKVDSIAFVIRHPENIKYNDVPSCTELRLFSSGGGSELIEWDLERGCVRRTISSQGGAIWSIAANPASNMLALGCEDGSVRLLSLVHDTLSHHRRFDRVKCRLLSIAWGPPVPRQVSKTSKTQGSDESSEGEDDEDDWNDSWLVTGGSDSSLRKWDVSTGRVLDRMATDKMRGERTLVWTVGVLGDGTIVSGDSLGMVKFWDSRTCTQLQSFQGHGADVLCLTVGPEGTNVYSSGVDQKVTQFSLVQSSSSDSSSVLSSSSRWVQTSSRRLHSHDVRALATWPPYTALPRSYKRRFPADVAPILASGGLDMSVVLTPAALPTSTIAKVINPLSTSTSSTFEDSYHRRLAYPSAPAATSAIRVARHARLLLCMGDTSLNIWKIIPKISVPDEDSGGGKETSEAGWEKVLEMELNVHTNLVASAISDDGRWLVASDTYETKLFSMETQNDGGLKPKRIRDFSAILQPHLPESLASTGGSAFCFTPDSSKLVMSTTLAPYVIIIDLRDDLKPRVLRRFDHHRTVTSTGLGAGSELGNGVGGRTVKKRRKKKASVQVAPVEIDESANNDMTDDHISSVTTATVSRMAVSIDGQWLATTDDLSRTHVFNLDSVKHHYTLPSFSFPVHALAFSSARPDMLVLGFPDNTFQIFDVEARQFPEWSRELAYSSSKSLTKSHEPILGVTFDPAAQNQGSRPRYALFWGSTWLCQVKLDIPPANSKKRQRYAHKRNDDNVLPTPVHVHAAYADAQPENYKMITHYRPLLYVDFIAPGELVVVERPLVDVLATLPPAYFKPKMTGYWPPAVAGGQQLLLLLALAAEVPRMLSSRALSIVLDVCYALLVLTTSCAIALSCVALLSQAVRTAPTHNWTRNFNALIIGAAYIMVLLVSMVLCLKRRIAVRRRLQRISRTHKLIGRGDAPQSVREYVSQEYMRTCLVAYESQPRDAFHEGWGQPGTKYSGVYFRRALLDTIADIDALAHVIIPTHPILKPHLRMLHHFRYILPLLPSDEDGFSPLHYYDSAIQLARTSSKEPTETEFEIGMRAASEIKKILDECREEMTMASILNLNGDQY